MLMKHLWYQSINRKTKVFL